MDNIKLAIGTVAYGESTAKYLPEFYQSLKKQTYNNFKWLVIDNTEIEDNPNKVFFSRVGEAEFRWAGSNLGFAKANNMLIGKAREYRAEYFLALNHDMLLRPDAIEKMLAAMESGENLASVSPKVLRWDFENRIKTKTIDTCGIVLRPGLKFIDLGQAEPDSGQYDLAAILGPSGCAALYRISSLESVAYKIRDAQGGEQNEYFDEMMFMYKEDCDLDYRLFLAGYGSKLAPDAIVYHDRTAGSRGETDLAKAASRWSKSRQVKEWSLINQLIIFAKYWSIQPFKDKLAIVWYGIKIAGFMLIFEQYLLEQISIFFKIRKNIRYY